MILLRKDHDIVPYTAIAIYCQLHCHMSHHYQLHCHNVAYTANYTVTIITKSHPHTVIHHTDPNKATCSTQTRNARERRPGKTRTSVTSADRIAEQDTKPKSERETERRAQTRAHATESQDMATGCRNLSSYTQIVQAADRTGRRSYRPQSHTLRSYTQIVQPILHSSVYTPSCTRTTKSTKPRASRSTCGITPADQTRSETQGNADQTRNI